ncbi:HYDROLYZING O-GLYCOSYL COMPOUNDS putative-RELATED [Salix koriyanagi]|uniref:HYDROLYZING O-GLYCOSYL COMPOUNDS putative-RELATED n=1 Tax=Salix koriyanagi TaxID=2511006 RepID=A0A9Q0TRH2_9ROSI|nr:HYDROLYZING O-GLYCOSYL COMPOUNDS putative-RELATED [Salix koriyanagi]
MKILAEALILVFLCIFLGSEHRICHAFSSNYNARTKCLIEPEAAQDGGGIIANPDFTHGMDGWTVYGQGAMKEEISMNGNRFIVAYNRTQSLDSISQKVQLRRGLIYSFSAWIQINKGSERVAVVFKIPRTELIIGGRVLARKGCWSLLKGGIFANFTSHAGILFESKNTATEIWVDSVSLQPFTLEQWRAQQDKKIDKERKSKVRFKVTYGNGTAMDSAAVSIKQTRSEFPFGCGMNFHIIDSTDYQNWFASRFKYTTFTNQMKWYSNEPEQGQENYTVADTMVKFAQRNGISIRGHNILWDDPKYQPEWVKNLTSDELRKAAEKRVDSVVSRYSGQLIAWDVINENLHFSFFEDKLGKEASSKYFKRAYELDPGTTMFLNEFSTIEYSNDEDVDPISYMKKLDEILSYPGNQGILAGIGLEGHFGVGQPNLAYMRSVLDILSSTGLPIWLTEVDVVKEPNQAEYLEQILREVYCHHAVQGIIMFAGPATAGFNATTLVDKDFKNTASGDVVDKLIDEWRTKPTETKSDGEGCFEMSLFHGYYNITIKNPVTNCSTTLSYRVTKGTTFIHINA